MARTLGDLQQWALETAHEDPTNTVFTSVIVPNWVRQCVEKILTYTYWEWNTGVRQLTWPASAAEFSTLYLPEYVDKVLSVYPGTDEGVGSIDIIGAWEMDRYRPGVGHTLGRSYLVLWGWYWVENDNPTAAVLTMVSSAAAGGNGVQVRIEGRSGNREVRETVTLAGLGTGTTANTYDAGVDGVRRISLIGGTGAGTGVITVSNGGTDLAVLDSVWERYQEHQRTELYGAQGAASTWTMRFYRKHRRLEATTEYLPLPESFDWLVELFLESKIEKFRGKGQESLMTMGEFNAGLRQMLAWDRRQPGKKRRMYVRRQWGWRRRGGVPL